MRHFLLLLLVSCACAGEAASKPLPPDVQKIVDTREKAVAAAKAAYDEAVGKATAAASKQMDGAIKDHTKKGDLDGALAAKAVLEQWNAGDGAALLGPAPAGKGMSPADVVGTWTMVNISGSRVLTEDKVAMVVGAAIKGRWEIVGSKLVITYDGVGVDTFDLPAKDNVITGSNQLGVVLSMRRNPPGK